MRLLKIDENGEISLTDGRSRDIPPYAILSHTWGAEEVTFKDLVDGTGTDKAGYKKILFCGQQAQRHGLQYFWVDTCCIDKSNSAELSKAITSMFRWYRDAVKCYVYLSDVSTDECADLSLQPWRSAFQDSRWFTRGWTLQELIAPKIVEFYCSNGRLLGDKKKLEGQLRAITGIAAPALQGADLSAFSVAEKMSWAETRTTTEPEDKAYSLLGLFEIFMPLIYGEGEVEALNRLRAELYRREKKHKFEELSIVSPDTFNPSKRFKLQHRQSTLSYNSRSIAPESPGPSNGYSNGIDTDTKQSLIEQLYFTKIDERLTSLTAAQGKTCRWFLSKNEYLSWQDPALQSDHGGFLWIKGNPGTGKSTLMKLLFEEAKRNAKGTSQIIISFFFLARGTEEEKSTLGLYRALLHQLFEKAVDLRDSLEWMTVDGARGIQRNGWHQEVLKQTLSHAIQKLTDRPLTIFVDALDECDQSQVTDMVSFFEDLCDSAQEARVQIQICLSSRHYPTVVIQRGLEVILDDQVGHMEDIEQYIRSKLRLGKSKPAESLRAEILEKSSGIFLWVVLVLDILNSEYPGSSLSIKKSRERLKEIPPKLNDLFQMILARDGENLEQLQVCLQWILFATRPLRPPELYFAVQLTLDNENSGYWDQEDIDLDQMKTFVRSSSKGLAEVTRNKASVVQFIHESVRDFLFGRYESQWSGASGNFIGYSHDILKTGCLAQLNNSVEGDLDIHTIPQGALLPNDINANYPFFDYAVLSVLRHANSAQQNSVLQTDFLHNFPLKRWIFFNNNREKYSIRRYTDSVSLLYILAENNLADLIINCPGADSCFVLGSERYGPPFFAALANDRGEAIGSMLEVQLKHKPLTSPLHDLCKTYCRDRKKWTKFGTTFNFPRGRTVSSYVAEHGEEVLLSIMIQLDEDTPNTMDKNGRTALSWAAEHGQEEVTRLMLKTRAMVISDKKGLLPLHWAVQNGHINTVNLLLEDRDTDANPRTNSGWTPLHYASEEGYSCIVSLLLKRGVSINDRYLTEPSPLHLAAIGGHIDVVRLLLKEGANTASKDATGLTPLHSASASNHLDLTRLLLVNGSDVNAVNREGATPLYCATRSGHDHIVKLLLEKGANANVTERFGPSILLLASINGHFGVTKLLLEWGADMTAVDRRGWTPLHEASYRGFSEIVQVLLKEGANVAATTKDGETPLHLAALAPKSPLHGTGHTDIVKLLLYAGADAAAESYDGSIPLKYAHRKGHDEIVQILKKKLT